MVAALASASGRSLGLLDPTSTGDWLIPAGEHGPAIEVCLEPDAAAIPLGLPGGAAATLTLATAGAPVALDRYALPARGGA